MDMYNVVGNEYYCITKERKVLRKDGLSLDVPETDKTVTLPIYGFNKTVDKEWLFWVAYFKLEFPKGFRDRIFDLDFKNNFSLLHMRVDPKIVVFKEPVYVDKDKRFRMIARFPMYAIDYSGVLINLHNGKIYKSDGVIGRYNAVTLNDQAALYVTRNQMTHRLVAITWVPNDDYEKYYLVDHKDGDKSNCHYTNLRWMDHIGNNKAAVIQGLRTAAIKVITRNINTGEEAEHNSITDASEYMSRSRINTTHQPLVPHKIWTGTKGEFEMKQKGDPREWYYIDKEVKPPIKLTMNIEVILRDEIRKFTSIREAAIALLGKDTPLTTKILTDKILEKYPEAKISIDKTIIFQAKYGEKVYEAESIPKLIEVMGNVIPKSTVTKYMGMSGGISGWQFRIKPKYNDIPWPEYYEQNKYTPQQIKVLNTQINKEMTFNSLRQAASHFGIDKKTVQLLVRDNKIFKNIYKFIVSL